MASTCFGLFLALGSGMTGNQPWTLPFGMVVIRASSHTVSLYPFDRYFTRLWCVYATCLHTAGHQSPTSEVAWQALGQPERQQVCGGGCTTILPACSSFMPQHPSTSYMLRKLPRGRSCESPELRYNEDVFMLRLRRAQVLEATHHRSSCTRTPCNPVLHRLLPVNDG